MDGLTTVGSPEIDIKTLWYSREELNSYKEIGLDTEKVQHTEILMDHLRAEFDEIDQILRPMLAQNTISYDYIWAIFRPGSIAVTHTHDFLEEPNDESLLVHEEESLDLMTLSLHRKMRELSIKRQNQATIVKKIQFALYDEKHLKSLIENVATLTNELMDLFPALKLKQSELATREVSDFSEPFWTLSEAATGQDEVLVSALKKVLNPVNNLMTFNTKKSNVQKMGTDTGGLFPM